MGRGAGVVGHRGHRRRFTGQRLDGTGLYYYTARYYDPTLGRFISPDMLMPGAGNPQAWNHYAYVLNNPLRYTDPSGYFHLDEEILQLFNTINFMLDHNEDGFYDDPIELAQATLSDTVAQSFADHDEWGFNGDEGEEEEGGEPGE